MPPIGGKENKMNELKPNGFETADALDRFRAVRRGQPFNILWPSDIDEAIEVLEEKLNRRPATENKPLTCNGCAYEPYAPSEEHCFGCTRMYGDHYYRKPEQEEYHA